MITDIFLKNFRGFDLKKFSFEKQNLIYGKNGKGKSTILEAITLFSHAHNHSDTESLVKKWEDFFRVELFLSSWESISVFYDAKMRKKKYFIGQKESTLTKLSEKLWAVIFFEPLSMNMLYLSPNIRRNFLDTILSLIDPRYKTLLQSYKKACVQRNRLLKAIAEKKMKAENLDFWESEIISLAQRIYSFRFLFRDFINDHKDIFTKNSLTDTRISFFYDSKIIPENIEKQMKQYFEKNRQRDILMARTTIGPHVDDFYFADTVWKNLIHFASRGEMKTLLIQLLSLSAQFIIKNKNTDIIFLIDDLLSELDIEHRSYLSDSLLLWQGIITSIEYIDIFHNTIFLE